jgi:hypothetical protein
MQGGVGSNRYQKDSDTHADETTHRPFHVIARSPCDEAIQLLFCKVLDCFAEFIIGRRFAPTRWLAMTRGAIHGQSTVILLANIAP